MKSCFLHCLLVSGFLFCLQVTKAQNLAPNPGFEEYDPCPDDWGNGGSLQSSPWQNGNLATSDYFNTCATGTNVWVPDNFAGSQTAHSGNGYVGFYIREASVWREYIQAPLLSPLIAGTTYHVSFYLSLADNYCATSNIGAFFSAVPPDPANNIGTLNATPQVEANVGFINNTGEWMLITGCFVAQGGEQWVTIGNFYNNANTPLEPGCSTSFASYYYLDDVSVEAGDPAEEIELDLEDDVTTCASSFTINSGVSNVDYHWSTGETTPNITVTESDEYFLTITSGCASAVDSITVTFETSAQVQLGPPGLSLCQGETFYASLDPALGIYTWQDGSHNPVYTVTTPGIYSVTLENACGTSSDVIEILYTNIPAGFSLGDDVSICQGEEISFSFDPALGQFTWQDGSHSHEYTITAPGVYSLTISNECGSVSDQIIVTQSAGPQVDLGPSEVTFCDNEEISIDLNFDTQLGDFLWQDGSTGAAYHIDAPGIYSVTVTNACGMSDDEITVFAASAPAQFSLGDDAEICSGEIIEYNFDSALGDFEWQDQSTSSSYTISSGGVYHLTISNGCGAVSDTITVTEHTAPQINLGQDATLCEGESIVISLDPVLGEFLWQDGSTLSDYTISQAGVYSVTVTNSCGQNEDAREIFVVHSFPLELGSDIIVCPAALPVTLDVSTANATNYTWQDNSTQPVYQVMASGTYAVTVSNECFEKSDQINVIVEDSAPVVTLPDDLTLCPGDTLTLTAGNLQGEFLWQDQSEESSFEVIASGTYSLQVSNDCGVGTDTVNVVFENPLTPPDLGDDLVLCEGTTYTLHLTADGNNIRWQDGSNADSMIVDHAGMYFAEIFNACSSATDTIIVTIDNDPPVLDFQDTILLCAGQTLQINPGISGVDFVWSTGASSAVIDVTLPEYIFLL